MNQQRVLAPRKTKSAPKGTFDSSQDGRGGTFYVLDNPKLFESRTTLLKWQTAPALP
jgi:hypothetical protein